jgi:hypothetical protein
MRILLDQNVPSGVRSFFTAEHEVVTAYEMGWARLSNGALLARAEAARFDVLVTADQSMTLQQNMAGRRLRLVVLWTNRWAALRDDAARVVVLVIGDEHR